MEATLTRGRIKLRFDYNPGLIYQIKQVKGREYDPFDKVWFLPLTEESMNAAERIGFDVSHIREQTKNEYAAKLERFGTLNKLIKEKWPFLYKHQVEGAAKSVVNKRLLVADEVGLGKTVQGYVAAFWLMEHHRVPRLVVCCPQSIKWQWRDEAKKWFDKDVVIIEGTPNRRKALYNKKPEIMIINYEQILRDFEKISFLVHGNILILDEASYIKNPDAKRTRLIKRLHPAYLFALTGTPVENRLQDAWVIGNIVHPNWMSKNEYYSHTIYGDKFGFPLLLGYKDVDKFMERLMEIGIRRKRTDVSELPPHLIYERFIPLTKPQKVLEDAISTILMSKEGEPGLEEFVFYPMIEDSTELILMSDATTLTHLNKSNVKIDSPKIRELRTIIEDTDEKKIIIFTRFKKMAEVIARELGEGVVMGAGGCDKEWVVKEFRDNPAIRFLVATEALAYGVDLPFADMLINFDIPWNPARLKQRVGRMRYNKDKRKMVFNLISEGLESHIYEVMCGKEALFGKVMAFNLREQLYRYIGYTRR